MKHFYSIIGSFLIIGSAFAQGVSTNYKMAQKKLIDTTLPKVIKASAELRSAAVDCSDEFYCENFESVSTPALPADMSTSSIETNYYVPTDGGNVQVSGFFTGNSQDAGAGGYWTYLDEHTTFAMTNDDSCLLMVDDEITYAIQYTCENIDKLNEYQEKHAPKLQEKHTNRYRGKFGAFRTLLEIVHQH